MCLDQRKHGFANSKHNQLSASCKLMYHGIVFLRPFVNRHRTPLFCQLLHENIINSRYNYADKKQEYKLIFRVRLGEQKGFQFRL